MLKIIIMYRAYNYEKKQEYFVTIDELKELLYHITVTTIGYKAENAVLDEAYQTIIFETEKEYDRALEWIKTLKKPKRNCPNCIYNHEMEEKRNTYRTFCKACGHWLEWNKLDNCSSHIAKEE